MRRLDHMPSSGTGLDRFPHADDGGLDALVTEAGSRPGADYDLRSTLDLVELMNAENAEVPAAVGAAATSIAAAVDAISASLARGGRLIYVGAGLSGGSRRSTHPNASRPSPSPRGRSSRSSPAD